MPSISALTSVEAPTDYVKTINHVNEGNSKNFVITQETTVPMQWVSAMSLWVVNLTKAFTMRVVEVISFQIGSIVQLNQLSSVMTSDRRMFEELTQPSMAIFKEKSCHDLRETPEVIPVGGIRQEETVLYQWVVAMRHKFNNRIIEAIGAM